MLRKKKALNKMSSVFYQKLSFSKSHSKNTSFIKLLLRNDDDYQVVQWIHHEVLENKPLSCVIIKPPAKKLPGVGIENVDS